MLLFMTTLEKEPGLIGVRLTTAPPPQNTGAVPDLLYNNLHLGYALWVTWQRITVSAQESTQFIQKANAYDKKLIANTRERHLRNG